MVVGQVGSNISMYFHISGACPIHNVTRILGVVANWADVALAINRLIAVCFPFLYTHFASGKVGGSVCGLTWLIGIVVVVLLRSGIGSFFKEVRSIWFLSVITSGFGQFLLLMSAFVPNAINMTMTTRIAWSLEVQWSVPRNAVVVSSDLRRKRVDLKKKAGGSSNDSVIALVQLLHSALTHYLQLLSRDPKPLPYSGLPHILQLVSWPGKSYLKVRRPSSLHKSGFVMMIARHATKQTLRQIVLAAADFFSWQFVITAARQCHQMAAFAASQNIKRATSVVLLYRNQYRDEPIGCRKITFAAGTAPVVLKSEP